MKFSELFKGKIEASSAALRAARDQLSVADIEKRIAELTQARREALLSDDEKELRRIETDIEKANLEAERATLAIEVLTGKIAEAEAREHEEKIARVAVDQEKLWYEMRDNLIAIDKASEELARLLDINRVQAQTFKDNNHFLVHAERTDLKIWPVQSVFCEQNGLQPDPYQDVSAFQLPGYWPNRHPDGPRLGKLKGFQLPSRVSAREPVARGG